MKSIGIVRKLDELGRVTLPKELRRTLNIGEREPMEIFTEGSSIILKKANEKEQCCKCKEEKELIYDGGIGICKDCLMAFLDHLEE